MIQCKSTKRVAEHGCQRASFGFLEDCEDQTVSRS
jgi:hypothetical protein